MEALAVVSGWEVLARLAVGPLTLIVLLAVAVGAGFWYWRLRGRGRLRLVPIASALFALLLVVGLIMATVRPGQEYGVYLDRGEGEVVLRYMAGWEARAPLCGSRLALLPTSEALGLLERRDLGLSDPLSGVHMGVYTLEGGVRGYVFILEDSPETLLVEAPNGEKLLAALPGVEAAYEELREASLEACG